MFVESFASRIWTAGAPEVCERRTLTSDGDVGDQACDGRAQTGKRSQVRVWHSKEIDFECQECWFRGQDLAVRRRR